MTRLVALVLVLCTGIAVAAEPPKKAEPAKKHTNRLAKESSPYLLQHAHNPVDWYPWGPEAFAKAKKEGKLIFLSIGYSSCHWCHVMERESFENEEVAKLLDKGFVCIKVDREERPDVDHLYMTALQAMGQRGGWPLSIFLTADGKPVLGGTYWPREDKQIEGEKVHGFKSVIKVVQEFHEQKPEELAKRADRLASDTRDALIGSVRGVALVELDRTLVTGAVDGLKERYDSEYGGFGSPARKFQGPKFPTPANLVLLLQQAGDLRSDERRGRETRAERDMLTKTLDRMAHGGIYDQIGGGFHRYSTERTWTVPHFEKMLYDNAQLVEVYAHAYRRTKNPVYQRIVRETLAFVERELSSPDGGFYSALDADSEGEEGKYYIWTAKEIEQVLGEDADLFKRIYGIDGRPNFEEKFYIPTLPVPLAEAAKKRKLTEEELLKKLAPMRHKLLEVRSKRPRPLLDTKILTAWNGEMIAGYAVAGQMLEEPKYIARAAKAADFVLKNLRDKDGKLLRTYGAAPGQPGVAKLNGYLDDYAFLVDGLLCLHDATGEKKWLDEAISLTDAMNKRFKDPDAGGFFYTADDHEKLFARAKDQYDGAQPCGNSVAARNLVRLWIKTKEERYRVLARKTLKAFAGPMKLEPAGLSMMATALAMYLDAEEKKK
jgi:uncharacterized protein YyaL (SSP411 family)